MRVRLERNVGLGYRRQTLSRMWLAEFMDRARSHHHCRSVVDVVLKLAQRQAIACRDGCPTKGICPSRTLAEDTA